MKLIETNFNSIKKMLNKIIVKRATITVTDYMGDNYEYDEDSPTHEEISICLFDINNYNLSSLKIFFLRDNEVRDNLEMPLPKELKYEYLDKIFEYFVSVESQIHEDEDGNLSCDLFTFEGFEQEPLTEYENGELNYKTSQLRKDLRNEIKYYYALKKKYEFNKTTSNDISETKNFNNYADHGSGLKNESKQSFEKGETIEQIKINKKNLAPSFCWNKSRPFKEDMLKLHTLLKEAGFIATNTPFDKFCKAFSSEPIDEELGIVWSKKVKGKLSKPLLLHFIEELQVLKLIEPVLINNELYIMIQAIFKGPENENLKYFAVSRSTWIKRPSEKTSQELELNLILQAILKS
jgi:hypothetical protein